MCTRYWSRKLFLADSEWTSSTLCSFLWSLAHIINTCSHQFLLSKPFFHPSPPPHPFPIFYRFIYLFFQLFISSSLFIYPVPPLSVYYIHNSCNVGVINIRGAHILHFFPCYNERNAAIISSFLEQGMGLMDMTGICSLLTSGVLFVAVFFGVFFLSWWIQILWWIQMDTLFSICEIVFWQQKVERAVVGPIM